MSEEIVGSWLKKQDRSKFIVATKARGGMGDDVNARGLSRKHLLDAVEASLKRLQTDYIDLYQIHGWDDGTPLEETLSTLDYLVNMGKVRYLGACNLTGWQMQKITDWCQFKGFNKWISLQQQYNLLCRESEFEVLDVCKNEGIGVLPWSPLKGGLLSGKYQRNSALPADSRLAKVAETGQSNQANPDFNDYKDKESFWTLVEAMADIGKQYGKSVAQVALRWLLQKDTVPSVVTGVKTTKQLDDNMGAASGWALTQDQMATLDELSRYDVPYPYEMVRRLNKDRKH